MITFPYNFIPTQFPGYFINVDTGTVFSCKRGILKELKRFRDKGKPYGYAVSVNGAKKYIKLMDVAVALSAPHRDHMIPAMTQGLLDLGDGGSFVEVTLCDAVYPTYVGIN